MDPVQRIREECLLRGYSEKTISSYLFHITKFLNSKEEPRDYLLALISSKKSAETVRSACFAMVNIHKEQYRRLLKMRL